MTRTSTVQESGSVASWTHPGGAIAGYDLYLGAAGQEVKLNQSLLTGLSYTDTGYGGDERRYTVIAVDEYQVESVARSVTLPVLRATLAEGSRIERGLMNRLEFLVTSNSSSTVDNVRLKVAVEGYEHTSATFSIEPGSTITVPVTVGGYADLPDFAGLTTTIEITPGTGEKVEIVRNSGIEVGDGVLALTILNEEFTRGATGTVSFTLENTGGEEIEIITATGSGGSASNEVTFYLLDTDGNVLSSKKFQQTIGTQIVALANGKTVARIPAGEVFTSDPVELTVPQNAPDQVTIQLEIKKLYYYLGKTDQVSMNGLSSTHDITLIDTSYYGEVLSISPQTSSGDEDIVISGQAVERSTGLPLGEVPLELVISVSGFNRTYQIYTEPDGTFVFNFTPLSGEAGRYYVRAVHPDLLDRPVQGQFVISRLSISPTTINLSIPRNYERAVSVRLSTSEGTQVNNAHLIYDPVDQPQGVLPPGVHLTIGNSVSYLGSKQSAYLNFTIWADNSADETGTIILKVKSDETSPDAWGSVIINTHFTLAQPVLYFTPNHVETGVAHDDTVTETIYLENKGLADLADVSLALVLPDGSPAPGWVYLNTPSTLGDIAVGEKREVSIGFSPTASQAAEGTHSFKLRVESSNYPQTDINLYVSVTQSGIGSALFKVTDIYTGTLDANSQIIQGLAGARVKVQNEEVLTVEETLNTDSLGEAQFNDLPAGNYKYRITANNHQEKIGRIWIKPGITTSQEVFLDYNLVTVEWEVTETTIEDKYDIVLTTTFQTDVPAAVVVAEPSSVNLPPMKAGDVYNGEFTLVNHGLIRAENISFALPAGDQNFKYDLLGGIPSSIEAKERITVPYRVTALQSLSQEEGGSGGGCERYRSSIKTNYSYVCANGTQTNGATDFSMIYDNGECAGSTATGGSAGVPIVVGGGVSTVGGPSGGGGSVSSSAPAPKAIEGVKCLPVPERKEDYCEPCERLKASAKNVLHKVMSSVNTVLREYNREDTDLVVKVPSGSISIFRRFYGNAWHWEHQRNNLLLQRETIYQGGSTALGSVVSIDKGGVIYKRQSTSPPVFVHDVYKITETATGYRWQDKRENFKDYEAVGGTYARMTSYGTRNGVVGKLLYEPGEDGKLIGITDKNDNQVIWLEYNVDGRISAVYDAENRRVDYTYTSGRLTSVNDVFNNDTFYEYDGNGRISKVIDAAGREVTISYDQYNSVASVLDSQGNGHFFEYDYDEAKKEAYARITTSAGTVKEIWYDKDFETKRVDINGRTVQKIVKDGRALIITDENGNVTREEYDEWDNLTRVVYPDGSEVTRAYDHKFNKPVSEVTERGVVTTYEYDAAGNLTRRTDAAGTASERVTEYTFDSDGNPLTIKVVADMNTAEALTTMEYDSSGNLSTLTDPELNVTRFTSHDTMGNVLTREDGRGKIWTYEYDAAGRLKSITDPLNNITQIFYDEVGNKVREVDAELNETAYVYDQRDNLIQRIDDLGNSTLFEYNADGKLIRQTDPEGKGVYHQYDLDGRLKKTIDGNGNEIVMEYDDVSGGSCSSCPAGGRTDQPARIIYPTFTKEFRYDNRGRKIEERDVLSATETYLTTFAYDSLGNLSAKTDNEGRTTLYEYDELNRLKKVIDPLLQETVYTYDDRDNLIALTDANENTTTFEHDRNNRLVKEIRPMGEGTTYQYDGVGNLIQKLDAKNQKTEYGYDDAGRLTEIRYYSTTDHVTQIKTVSLTYDKVSNLKTYNDGTTSAAYVYDGLYRKTSETVDYGTLTLGYSYAYYKNWRKKSFTGPDAITYRYTYDNNNQLASVLIPGQGSITYSSYAWSQPASITLPGGAKKDYVYDPLMRMKSITVKDPAQNVLMNYDYNYDRMDNITQKDTEHGPYAYTYDELYRLTTVDNPALDDEGFTFDPVGNRLTAVGVSGNWAYNDNNELLGYDNVSFEYDENGNTTRKTDAGQIQNYFYDVENRLVRVEGGTGTVIATYYYDPFGRRLWKEVGGVKTYFVYSDEGLIGEYNAIGTAIKTYCYRPNSPLTIDLLFMKQGSDYYFYQNDYLGTPMQMTAVNGRVMWSATYQSFGNAQVDQVSNIVNNMRFAGQYYDEETGLHYNYYRYYRPDIGRYFRADPKGIEGGINLFSYCLNNPIRYLDPFGLQAPVYPGAPKPTAGDFVEVINHFLNLYNARHLVNKSSRLIDNLASTIKCDKVVYAHLCFKVGPPPRDPTVGLRDIIRVDDIYQRCTFFELRGTMNCKCIDEILREPSYPVWKQGGSGK